jgi:hypothetical protein
MLQFIVRTINQFLLKFDDRRYAYLCYYSKYLHTCVNIVEKRATILVPTNHCS